MGVSSAVYFLLLVIWTIAFYLGIKILINQVFNKNFSMLKLIKKTVKQKYSINVLKRIFDLKVFQILNSLLSKITELLKKPSPFMNLFLYTLFLLLITVLSQLILPEKTPEIWLSRTISVLGTIAIIIIPIILINYVLSFFILSIKAIPDDVKILNSNKPRLAMILIFTRILYLIISPAITFAFIYGFAAFINGLPNSLDDLINFNYFVHSFIVSFPIPTEDVMYQSIAGWKYISIIQVITQKLVEIGLLGYLINYIYDVIKHKKHLKY